MSFRNLFSQDFVSGVMRAGFEGRQIAVAYGRPVFEKSADLSLKASSWATKNPGQASGVGVGAAISAFPGIIATPILSWIGFTPGGIQAGSYAAFVHSSIGNIAPGSWMAAGQSAGAGGWGLSVVNSASQLVGATVSLGSAGTAWLKAKFGA